MNKPIRILQCDKPQACRGGHAVSNAVAIACPVVTDGKICGERFPLKKRGDISSAYTWMYHDHLRLVHGIFLPKAEVVLDSHKAGK